jgi:type I restriction enzyme S subunit
LIPAPPYAEQEAIAGFLIKETTKIDGLIAKVHGAIDRLHELRAPLISAAVTGKIDVREEAGVTRWGNGPVAAQAARSL